MVAPPFPARCLDAVPFFFINGCSGPSEADAISNNVNTQILDF
jgi:hypothetical protein